MKDRFQHRWGSKWVFLSVLLCSGGAVVWADQTGTSINQATCCVAGGNRMDHSLRKLGRGIANVFTSPLEIPRTATLVGEKEGFWAGSSVGLVQGLWRTVSRAAVGVFEVVTFYAEIPKDYQPIMKPEFVWANGNWVE